MATSTLAPVLHYVRRLSGTPPVGEMADGELLRRFARSGDAAAFEWLVRRHGPMVLGACRRVLHHTQDAEDAFQATFLLLARKARSLRRPDRLGPWLHGVAIRTALKARAQAARRREQPVTDDPPAPPVGEPPEAELRSILDAAIDRLPAKERTAVVLCHLQGLTYGEAAERLGCPLGTLAARLARARQRLRVRLTRQGLAPAAAIFTAGMAADAPALPPALVASTVVAALTLAAGVGTDAVSGPVLSLVNEVQRTMLWNTWKVVLAALLALGAVGAGAGILCYRTLAAEPPAQTEPPTLAARNEPDAGPARGGERAIPLALLRQKPPDVYRLDTGDVLGIFIEGILGERNQVLPYIQIQPAPGATAPPPAMGYPIVVQEGGRLDLPLIEPINVRGKSVTEVLEMVRGAYLKSGIIRPGQNRIIVSLAKPRTYRVTIVRHDLAGRVGGAHRDASSVLELSAYENDVLTALARSGGVPAPGTGSIAIERGQAAAGGTVAAIMAGVKQVRIPLRVQLDKPMPFQPEDVILRDGDIIVVEYGDAEPESAGSRAAEPGHSGGSFSAVSLAVAAPDGRILVQMPAARARRAGVEPVAAQAVPGMEGHWQLFAAPPLQAFETDGRPIDGKALAERLQKMTAVLVATGGHKPDPLYLQAVKPGTPVLVVP
jgi:RNA polymerase sigma factor (sigma-70 family)